jgi:hypothetical protein
MTPDWQDLLAAPKGGDHIVQLYQDKEFLSEAVVKYVGTGLRRDEAAILIARPEHREAFGRRLRSLGFDTASAIERGQLRFLDAADTLAEFMRDGLPEWNRFREVVGGAIAELRLQYPAVRAYGEMVDILWQQGERDAAIRLEEFWNEIAKLQTFSLFCAYYMDNLDKGAYGGPLECVCQVHTHLIPARDYGGFNEAVDEASSEVLGRPLTNMLLSLSERHRPATQMPMGQATLLWLQKNMPRTAEKILDEVKQRRQLA